VNTSWLDAVKYFQTQQFEHVIQSLTPSMLPSRENIFRVFREVPFDKVKVVILGQDPYPNRAHACGLAFSVPPGTSRLPKSLTNIFTELEKDVGKHRENGDLSDWAQQGVFLLNTALTCEEGKPGSHTELWRGFTDDVIRTLSNERENIVFVLWGNHAINKARLIDDEKHMVITSVHPSPLSAHRGFFGSKCFSRINNCLHSINLSPIIW
jgi:uracil-DNA glycosylase